MTGEGPRQDRELHDALRWWSTSPGAAAARQAVLDASSHHGRAALEAAYRISRGQARVRDWCTIAEADPHASWPQLTALAATGPHGERSIDWLRSHGRLRSAAAGDRLAWILPHARVTRVGRSVAVGAPGEDGSTGPWYVPALSTFDPSAAFRWSEVPEAARAPGTFALLATRFSYSGYWHWLMEGLLPTVRLDEAGLLRRVDRLLVLVEDPAPRFIMDSLRSTGIDIAPVELRSSSIDVVVDQLIIPTRHRSAGGLVDDGDQPPDVATAMRESATHDPGADIAALRRRLGLEGTSSSAKRRFYISRRDATKRRVANEAELLVELAELDFHLVVPGALSFREQVDAFAAAEVIVGPHGAGLANLLFARPSASVLELHHAGQRLRHYARMAERSGVGYQHLPCAPDPGAPQDMVVDVDAAVAMVRRVEATTH